MKNLLFFIIAVLMLSLATECVDSNRSVKDGVKKIVTKPTMEFFFKKFQEGYPDWYESKEGKDSLKKAFEERMLNDIEFAKVAASYRTDNNITGSIFASESISPYKKNDGEEGEVKAFKFKYDIPLKKPLYTGEKEIGIQYEIISLIPSTEENHKKPYITNINDCKKFDPYIESRYADAIDLGSYIIANTNDRDSLW